VNEGPDSWSDMMQTPVNDNLRAWLEQAPRGRDVHRHANRRPTVAARFRRWVQRCLIPE
jgi:hypothetical protein